MTDHVAIDAIIVGKHVRRTIGTCRQYAEQSKAWQNGEGRSEDQHLQRIWNLADDSVTLIDFAHALVARAEATEDALAEALETIGIQQAEVARLREALAEIVSYIDKGDVSIETIDQIALAALAKEDTDE